ncbi:ATP phosphoribosyltransferase regulatory subunit [Lentibacillus salicampi]|uniref:ATP phosphoribosyltransferase regulatory subunit n=1 Tax=Lentibacillus salicampi TaxID=175306 RepID=A0A4Y9A7U5_9BACI|nr:ATP phosphoribosyltransferase regulatory subunit [Lentibacillus salicampi]TFJ90659.1 ATP phosphoribosyltransferase regulatory subunit [Lentibacillus salicampi]
MQSYVTDAGHHLSQTDYQLESRLLSAIRARFRTYGYQETGTSTFQDYDMYASLIGTVGKHNMIKTIDPSGDVLVLRPDVTIPVARRMAAEKTTRRRLFYVQDVFRQPQDKSHHKEFTQAGVECFGENTPENDAETIALAVHLLQDLQFDQFKVEIGHAGFFKDLIEELPISTEELRKLQELIQSKNLVEIGPFLNDLSVEESISEAIKRIPLLYGDPRDVIEKALTITLNDNMKQTIEYLKQVYHLLTVYGIQDSVVFDLGLINHMNYYSGIIFQGYLTGYSKPVLMGGRYNDLTKQFGADIPAIGFGCIIDYLLEARKNAGQVERIEDTVEVVIYYEQSSIQEALPAASKLRNAGYQVLTQPIDKGSIPTTCTVYVTNEKSLLVHKQKQMPFQSVDELEQLLRTEMRET